MSALTPPSAPSGESRPGLSIVIPCYNEEASLACMTADLQPAVAALARTRSVEVVLVDDGSSDATWDRLTDLARRRALDPATVTLLRHERNRGVGAAVRTGLHGAHGTVIVTTDSDSTYRFTEISALLGCLTPEVDIVTASPYHPQGGVAGVPEYRLVLSRGSSLIYRALVDWRVHTYTALFRAVRADVAKNVSFGGDGYVGVAELLVNAMLMGYRVAEYPTILHARAIGTSKARVLRIIRAHLAFQACVLARRLRFPRPSAAKAGRRPLSVNRG